MNEREARGLHGLRYTGIYNSFRDTTKERIALERKEKPRSRIVMVTEHSMTRGGRRTGYSAYADDLYFAYNIVKDHKNYEEKYKERKASLEAKYKKDLEELNASYQKEVEMIKEAQAKIDTHC